MILKSRRFWLGMVTIITDLVLLVVSVQWPTTAPLVETIIKALVPVIVTIIIALTAENSFQAYMVYRAELARLQQK